MQHSSDFELNVLIFGQSIGKTKDMDCAVLEHFFVAFVGFVFEFLVIIFRVMVQSSRFRLTADYCQLVSAL